MLSILFKLSLWNWSGLRMNNLLSPIIFGLKPLLVFMVQKRFSISDNVKVFCWKSYWGDQFDYYCCPAWFTTLTKLGAHNYLITVGRTSLNEGDINNLPKLDLWKCTTKSRNRTSQIERNQNVQKTIEVQNKKHIGQTTSNCHKRKQIKYFDVMIK